MELIVTPSEPSVLRFSGMPQAPRPVEPWQGVREAVLFDQRCIQGAVDAQFGSEDCLHVNVYSPWLQTPHSEVGNRTTIGQEEHDDALIESQRLPSVRERSCCP